jgi:hypothetical protein
MNICEMARIAALPRRIFYIKGRSKPLKGMDFHIEQQASDDVLRRAAAVASAFRRLDWQPRADKHCLPTGTEVRQRGQGGREKI